MTIASLEKKLFTRDDAGFKKELFDILDAIEKGNPVLGGERLTQAGEARRSPGIHPLHKDASLFDNQNAVQRLATCITGFLCAPQLELTTLEARKLVFYKTHLTDIFYLSDFGNLDHVMIYRDLWSPEGGFQLKTDADIFLLMICWTINSEMVMPFDTLNERIPQEMLYMLTSVFYQLEQIQTSRGYDNFEIAFNAFLRLPDGLDITLCRVMLVNIWMGCSYWDIPNRHSIKARINRLIRSANPTVETREAGPMNKRPKIAIMLERYRSDHAVYRCFHAYISELKDHYEVCFFVDEKDVDDVSKNDADHCVFVEGNPKDIRKIAKQVNHYRPDVIFYLSLGMNIWTVLLANFRLAPVQIMGYGHPASAYTDTIDYGFLVGWLPGPDYQSLCTEKVINFTIDSGSDIELHPRTDLSLRAPVNETSTSVVHIAVNSSLMKISDRVLQVCRMLRQHSEKPIEFHFFPAHERGFKLLAFQRKLAGIFGSGFHVHPPCHYELYMQTLAQCHFAIGTFPFGGTNTNTDSVLLSQPKLYLKSEGDLAELTDYCNFARFDPEAGFVFSTELELIATAIVWIHNPSEHADAVKRAGRMRDVLLNTLATSSDFKRQENLSFLRGFKHLIAGEPANSLI
ncbi:hypothetical protein EZI54_08325 [Marinobacter halodurans]|uniref:HMW1C N-terminal domain-containing protein n=1 Tax=Marinobacter halodurans TaxID=2528979 RepID=A0ABY1ZNE8_9GAMM|nr:hypothetical protein [Marinobacter halodurans]TBW56649.1 hypothetical protein EZI54_08325 [Marinobacter halodurans]